jgi:hypothetical protein
MPNSVSRPTLTRRRFTQLSGMAVGSLALSGSARAAEAPDVTLEIAPYTLEASPKHHIRTVAYNSQIALQSHPAASTPRLIFPRGHVQILGRVTAVASPL